MELPEGKIIVLFDGVCNLCDSMVNHIIRRDKNDIFRFDSLQSENGAEILKHIGRNHEKIDSLIVYVPGKAYFEQSDAALEIARHIGYRIPASILKVIPKSIRDRAYRFIAKNRYKWYGKKEQCLLPTPEIRAKFLK